MLSKIISPSDIKINLESSDWEECLSELLEVIVARHPGLSRKEAFEVLRRREEKGSTAIYPYVAVPHAVCPSLTGTAVAIGVSKTGVEFEPLESSDGRTAMANVVFCVLCAENDAESHIGILRDVLQLVSAPDFINDVLGAESSQAVFEVIQAQEK